jgi:hypothetical protein
MFDAQGAVAGYDEHCQEPRHHAHCYRYTESESSELQGVDVVGAALDVYRWMCAGYLSGDMGHLSRKRASQGATCVLARRVRRHFVVSSSSKSD